MIIALIRALFSTSPKVSLAEISSRQAGASITPNEDRAIFGAESYPRGDDDPHTAGVPK